MADVKAILVIAAGDIKAVFGTVKTDIKKVGSGGGLGIATSYDNDGGSGDRTGAGDGQITATQSSSGFIYDQATGGVFFGGLFNGTKTTTNEFYLKSGNRNDKWLRFDFGGNKVINEAKYYQQNDQAQATFQWAGSTDGSDFTDIGGTFQIGSSNVSQVIDDVTVYVYTFATLSANTTAYRYYRLTQVSGASVTSSHGFEFEFKISG
tara:strand:- start:776 stop:1396 length:621 start_codon:yes stop_codon:yes gene_type:complete